MMSFMEKQMDKHPTPAQVKKHYKAIRYFYYKLHQSLNSAHRVGVLNYQNYEIESPCYMMSKVKERIDNTTMKSRADAFKRECMDELKNVWY